MENYWLRLLDRLEIFQKIDEKIIDAWIDELTIGDLLNSMTENEKKLFLSLKVVDCGAELTGNQIDISVKLPEFEEN